MKKKLYAYLSILFVVWGCAQKGGETQAHSGEEKVQFTIYTSDWELFAEADPIVAGNQIGFLAHFTRLRDFKPLDPVPVSLTFVSGGQEFRQVTEPEREGIYRFTFLPEKAGPGVLTFSFRSEDTDFKIEIPALTVYRTEEEADALIHQQEEDNTNSIVFTKEQSWKTGFATEFPEKKAFGRVIRAIASIEPVTGQEMVVSAKTGGILNMATAGNLTEGMTVGKGEFLFTVSGSGLAESNIGVKAEEARNNFLKAEADFGRKTELAKDKLIPEKELQEAKALYLNSKAIYENYRDNFPVSAQRVVSPMNGFIRQLLVQNGQFVEEGQPLLVVSQDKNLMLRADVLQKYLSDLNSIAAVTIKPLPGEKFYSLEELEGRIISVGKSLNPENGMIPVTLQVNNMGGFTPGGIAEVYLRCTSQQPVLVLPATAVLEDQGLFFVFVQKTPELFEKREVIPGAGDGLSWEILRGINGQERVVTKGAILVKLARSSGALDPHAGHVH